MRTASTENIITVMRRIAITEAISEDVWMRMPDNLGEADTTSGSAPTLLLTLDPRLPMGDDLLLRIGVEEHLRRIEGLDLRHPHGGDPRHSTNGADPRRTIINILHRTIEAQDLLNGPQTTTND